MDDKLTNAVREAHALGVVAGALVDADAQLVDAAMVGRR